MAISQLEKRVLWLQVMACADRERAERMEQELAELLVVVRSQEKARRTRAGMEKLVKKDRARE
jgi:hypothetical protein